MAKPGRKAGWRKAATMERQVQVRFPESLYAEIERQAAEWDVPVSRAIRIIVRHHVNKRHDEIRYGMIVAEPARRPGE